MDQSYPQFRPAGDTAVLVELGAGIDRAVNGAVMALNGRLAVAGIPGIVETVPTFRSILIHYDPLKTSGRSVEAAVSDLLADDTAAGTDRHRTWHVPVCYDGPEFAPDLADVADRTGLSPEDVISRHLAPRYHIYMLGTYPGYPFMGDVDPSLALPRRTNPRLKVPAGTVGITGKLTGIYPLEAPGGWNLIGRSPVRLFDSTVEPPALFRPGDGVRFERVDQAAYSDIAGKIATGNWSPRTEETRQ